MHLALGDRQAVEVRPDAALEHGIAVDGQMVRRDRGGEVGAGGVDECNRFGRRDMLEYNS